MDSRVNRNSENEDRKALRKNEFSAAVVFDMDDARTVNCLIRDVSEEGAQLRIGPDCSIAPGSYLVNLKSRTAFELFPVWRSRFLMGVKFKNVYAIDRSLPDHLEFLNGVLVEAKLSHANRIVTHGICTREQQHRLALSYSSEL